VPMPISVAAEGAVKRAIILLWIFSVPTAISTIPVIPVVVVEILDRDTVLLAIEVVPAIRDCC